MQASVHAAASASLAAEVDLQRATIEKLERQLVAADEELHRLAPVDDGDERAAALAQRTKDCELNPRDIPAEDALDTIVRLENRLKLETRRNDLRSKEVDALKHELFEQRKVLKKEEDRTTHVIAVTGWNGKTLSFDEQQQKAAQIAEMEELERKLEQEHRAAETIIRKKTSLIEHLEAEIALKKEEQEQLNLLYNDIRVKDRDLQELEREIAAMTQADKARNLALVAAKEKHDETAFNCIDDDIKFLRDMVKSKKDQKRHQERVIKAQVDRTKALTDRLETIAAGIRDLALEARYAETMRGAVAATEAPAGAADDLDRIEPANEMVPVATYELLSRDLEAMRAAVSRKDIMVLEKEAVVAALDIKLEDFGQRLRLATLQQISTKNDKVQEMQHLHTQLAERHKQYRAEIDAMLHENLKLKQGQQRRRPAPVPKKAVDMRYR